MMDTIKQYLPKILGILQSLIFDIPGLLINLLFIYFLTSILKKMIDYHFRNWFDKKNELPINIFFNGSDVYFDVTKFDGENYYLITDIDAFNCKPGHTIVSSGSGNQALKRILIMVNKKHFNNIDIIKLFIRTIRIKHCIFPPNKKMKVSNKTQSNIVSILINNGSIK